MPNNRTCVWWSGHQLSGHHDHYLKGTNTAEVIECTGTCSGIQDLVHLKNLHTGDYLVPFDMVMTDMIPCIAMGVDCLKDSVKWNDGVHIQSVVQFNAKWAVNHPGIPPPNIHLPRLAGQFLRGKPCPRCIERWSEVSEDAERVAASVLAARGSRRPRSARP
ncbi:F-box-like domain protein [Ceratobasidium sp. AG-Ba]|nr:F-box-like domain protein [Ceratobasidium sp. AG-Ba]